MLKEYRRGEIFWYDFTYHHKGSEQKGLRPCIIVSNDICNQNSPVITGVPCTTAHRKPLPIHTTAITGFRRSTVLCELVCSIDKSRLGDYIGTVTEDEMSRIEKCLRIQLEI